MLRISKCSSYFMAVMTALLVRPDPWARERPLAAVRSFEQIYGEGRTVFYRTLTKVSLKSRLSDYDRSLFALAEEKFPGLYEYFMQFYYYLQRINREKASFRAEFLESSERLAKELVQSVYDVPVPPDQSILPYLLTTAGYGAAEGIPSFRYMLKAMESATKRQWAWQALEMRKTHRLSKGKGINLAIIDSGIDPTIRGIRGKISKTINFLDGSKPLAKKGHFPYDWTGHGTFVTCIAHQVAPESDLFIVKVASPARKNGLSFSRWTAYRFAAGIIWAALNGADVINLSYASTSDISVFQEACKFCWDRNIVLVAAAGNALTEQDKDLYYYPAAYPLDNRCRRR